MGLTLRIEGDGALELRHRLFTPLQPDQHLREAGVRVRVFGAAPHGVAILLEQTKGVGGGDARISASARLGRSGL